MLEQLFEVASLMEEKEYRTSHGVNWDKLSADCVGAWFTKQNCSKAGTLIKVFQARPKVWNYLKSLNKTMVLFYMCLPNFMNNFRVKTSN